MTIKIGINGMGRIGRMVVRSNQSKENDGLTSQDLAWQEQRRKRKVRKLDFEVR